MRILQLCAAYKPAYIYGGPTMSVSMLSENLVKAGVETTVYATTANGKTELPVTPGQTIDLDGVPVTYFKRITKDHSHYSPALFAALRREVHNFNVVHIHAWWNLISVFSCLIALHRNVPVILSPRGTLSTYSFQNKSIGVKWLLHRLLGKRLLKRCHIHATSQMESEAVQRLFKPKSITVLPNFVKLPARQKYPENARSPVLNLLFFSRIEEKKALDILLHALSTVTVPYTLTIAGEGDREYIETLKTIAADNGVAEHISWIGFQQENKFDVLQQHDLFVLPSYDENFGNTVIESLSVGTPVLISEGVGLADYVTKNDLGWICHTNPLSVAWEINNIAINSRERLSQIRNLAPDIIYNDFNDDNLVKRYINMYHEILNHE